MALRHTAPPGGREPAAVPRRLSNGVTLMTLVTQGGSLPGRSARSAPRSLHVPESRPTAELVVVSAEREALERWARRPKTAQAAAQRTRIVLACATGATNTSEPRTQNPSATQAPCPPHVPPRACSAGPAVAAGVGGWAGWPAGVFY